MKERKYIFIVSAVIALIMLFVLVTAAGYPQQGASYGYGPAMYPTILAGVILLCVVIVILETIRKVDKDALVDIRWKPIRRPLFLVVTMAAYALVLKLLGFVICCFAFLLINMLVLRAKTKPAIMVSLLLTLGLYALFKIVLKVPLPAGILF